MREIREAAATLTSSSSFVLDSSEKNEERHAFLSPSYPRLLSMMRLPLLPTGPSASSLPSCWLLCTLGKSLPVGCTGYHYYFFLFVRPVHLEKRGRQATEDVGGSEGVEGRWDRTERSRIRKRLVALKNPKPSWFFSALQALFSSW